MDTRGTSPQGPDRTDLRAAFQQQSRAGRTRDLSQRARQARLAAMIVSMLLGLAALAPIVLRLSQGVPAGLWIGVCALGVVLAPVAWLLAKLGRTRWTFVALAIGFALAQLGDASAKGLLG